MFLLKDYHLSEAGQKVIAPLFKIHTGFSELILLFQLYYINGSKLSFVFNLFFIEI